MFKRYKQACLNMLSLFITFRKLSIDYFRQSVCFNSIQKGFQRKVCCNACASGLPNHLRVLSMPQQFLTIKSPNHKQSRCMLHVLLKQYFLGNPFSYRVKANSKMFKIIFHILMQYSKFTKRCETF